MTDFEVGPNSSVLGSADDDYYLVDPNNLNAATIIEEAGTDTLVVYDRPGRTAGEFAVEGGNMVWRNFEGDSVTMSLGSVEFFEWRRLAEDGNPYLMRSEIFVDDADIDTAKFVLAGTQGDDDLESPLFRRFQGDWSEIYGNDGDDRLVGSNNHYVILYGGDGNDRLIGRGRSSSDMTGDAGNDVLRGAAGDDFLSGGIGSDRMSGGRGADEFQFNANNGNEGRDRITGFTIGTDMVVLSAYESDAVRLRQTDAGTMMTLLETGTRILLVNLDRAEVRQNLDDILDLG